MWPFQKSGDAGISFRRVDTDFATTGQILPTQLGDVAKAGFKSILCARPDNEEPGQPSFKIMSDAAKAAGLTAVHIPVSGQLTEGALIRMEQALATLPKPILGYCRSGARAGSLYSAALKAAR